MYRSISQCVILLIISLAPLAGCENNKPAIPIIFTYRESSVGMGYVGGFENRSGKHLAVRVNLRNETLNQEVTEYLSFSPHETKEIGWLEGWQFVSGEEIIISHSDYSDARYRIP